MRWLAALALLSWSNAALAAPCPRAVQVVTGLATPCDGTLLPDDFVARLLEDRAEKRRLEDVLAARGRAALALAEECSKQAELQRSALDACQTAAAHLMCPAVPWYRSFAFVFTSGIVTGAVLGVATTVLVEKLN